jgi:hypothetical protein
LDKFSIGATAQSSRYRPPISSIMLWHWRNPYHVLLADVASDVPCMIGDAIADTSATRSA